MDSSTYVHAERLDLPPERQAAILSHLMRILSQRHGLQGIVDYGFDLLSGNPVSILDTGMKLLASSSQQQYEDPLLQEQGRAGYLSERTVAAFRNDRQLGRLQQVRHAFRIHFPNDPERGMADVPGGMVLAPIRVGSTLLGYIIAAGLDKELPSQAETVIDLLGQASSIELQKSEFFANTRGIAYEALLNDILEGHAVDREQIERRFSMLGRKLLDEHYVLVVSAMGASPDAISREVSQATMRAFFPGSSSTVYQGAIVLLASLHEGQALPDQAEDLLTFLSARGLRMGVSGPFQNVARVPEQYRHACDALRLSHALFPDKRVMRYHDVAPFALIEAADGQVDLSLAGIPEFYRLWFENRGSSREMLETLFRYVRDGKSVEHASSELHIHRNTLFYRIKRMAELGSVDLNDGTDLARILLTEDVIRYRQARP